MWHPLITRCTVKCFPYPKHIHAIGIISTVTDVVTDLMIVSIPVLLLHKTQLRYTQKMRILTFLCLSVFMVAFAIARLSGGLMRDSYGVLTYSLAWTTLFLHIECSIAVLMGGVTAFRNVFKPQGRDEESQPEEGHTPLLLQYIRRMFGGSKATRGSDEECAGDKAPVMSDRPVTKGTLKGLRTFIRRNGRERGNTTMEQSMDNSAYDPLESYHNYKRHEQERVSMGTSTKLSSSTEVSGADPGSLSSQLIPTELRANRATNACFANTQYALIERTALRHQGFIMIAHCVFDLCGIS